MYSADHAGMTQRGRTGLLQGALLITLLLVVSGSIALVARDALGTAKRRQSNIAAYVPDPRPGDVYEFTHYIERDGRRFFAYFRVTAVTSDTLRGVHSRAEYPQPQRDEVLWRPDFYETEEQDIARAEVAGEFAAGTLSDIRRFDPAP